MLDEDNIGSIRLSDLKKRVKQIGETISSEELKDMIKKWGDGEVITFDKFYSIMTSNFI